MSKRHHGSTLDDFLREEGTFEENQALANREVVEWRAAVLVGRKVQIERV